MKLRDLEDMQPTLGRSLRQLLQYEGPGSVEDVFCQVRVPGVLDQSSPWVPLALPTTGPTKAPSGLPEHDRRGAHLWRDARGTAAAGRREHTRHWCCWEGGPWQQQLLAASYLTAQTALPSIATIALHLGTCTPPS